MDQTASILALDIGQTRVGVAKAIWPDGIPAPLTTLANDADLGANLRLLMERENAALIVAGRPRTLGGADSWQTNYTLELIERLEKELTVKIYLEDESATSLQAEAELKMRRQAYTKADIDALSAVYILEGFLGAHPGGKGLV